MARRRYVYRELWCERCRAQTRHGRAEPSAGELLTAEGLGLNIGPIEEALRAPWKCVACGSLVPWWAVPEV